MNARNGDEPAPRLARALRRMLGGDIGAADSPAKISAHVDKAYVALASRLVPLVGEAGLLSLLHRAAKLTGARFPWLADAVAASRGAPWPQIHAAAEAQPPETVFEAYFVLMLTVAGLLEKFIGPGLTARLLDDAWPGVFSTHEAEDKQ